MTTPAGWYDDGRGALRYWDGNAWTSHVAPAPAPMPGPVPMPGSVPTYGAAPVLSATSANPYRTADPFVGAPVSGSAPGKSRVGLFIAIGVGTFVLVAAMTVSAVMIFLQQKEAAPRATFDQLTSAWRAKDCPAEYKLSFESTTGTTLANFCEGADYSWVDQYQNWKINVTNVEQTGKDALVTTSETYTDPETGAPGTESWDYAFKLVDGKWYYMNAEPAN